MESDIHGFSVLGGVSKVDNIWRALADKPSASLTPFVGGAMHVNVNAGST